MEFFVYHISFIAVSNKQKARRADKLGKKLHRAKTALINTYGVSRL